MKYLFLCDVIKHPTRPIYSPAICSHAGLFGTVWIIDWPSVGHVVGITDVDEAKVDMVKLQGDARVLLVPLVNRQSKVGQLSGTVKTLLVEKFNAIGVDAANAKTIDTIFTEAIGKIMPYSIDPLLARMQKDFKI